MAKELKFSVKLATEIGLSEAIVINRLYQLLNDRSERIVDNNGVCWVRKSIEDWNYQFPFWSEHGIRNIFKRLVDNEYLIKRDFNSDKFDRTMWYTLNVYKLKGANLSE